jgi:hypothetical protein
MKKSILFWSFVMLVVFPAYLGAQESKDSIIVTKFGEVRASKDLVPAKVKQAVLNDFGESHQPFAWISNTSLWVITKSLFNDYEWRQSASAAVIEEYSYAFQIKSNTGSTLGAVYASGGKRISSREYLKNFKPGRNIVLALQDSEYKDWELKKVSQLIKVSSDGSEKQHYAIVVKKGKEKKTIHFDENSRMLAVEKGDHGELADLDR